jgi:peptidoglycan/LPS O-acetylase OafA/YrhL
MVLEQFSGGRDNNLNLIRIIAALGVLVSHAYPISLGPGALEPLEASIGVTLGTVSVYIFFVISGFLITQSFDRSSAHSNWLAARILRLYPALIVVTLATALVLGPWVTTLPINEYFKDPAVPSYVVRNIGLAFLQYELPGVFESNPYGGAINGSLWTLIYEIACYGGVLMAGLLGLVGRKRPFIAALAIYLGFNVAIQVFGWQSLLPGRVGNFLDLSLPFAIGMLFYAVRSSLPLSWMAGLGAAALAALAHGTPWFPPLFVAVLCYWVFLVAYLPGGFIRKYNELGDYSYGVYILAFPTQQLMVFLLGSMTPLQNMLLSTPIVLALSALSWHLIEKPALARKNWLASVFQKAVARRPAA